MKKVAIITGASSGIGEALAYEAARLGYDVVISARNVDKLTSVKSKCESLGARCLSVRTDVSSENDCAHLIQSAVSQFSRVDLLINNAGISCFSPITETGVEDFDRILSVNLRPVFITSRRLAIHRQSQEAPNPFGRIVNICSTRYLMSEPGSEGYAASKGGIYSLTHALALSLAQWHITVNSISPGWIETRDYEQLRPEDHAQHPSGRVGKPEDIARLCLFICQEENDFMNGENVTIDGGMTKKMIYIE